MIATRAFAIVPRLRLLVGPGLRGGSLTLAFTFAVALWLAAAPAQSARPAAGPVPPNGLPGSISLVCDGRVAITSLPFTISTPGSYFLRSDLTGVAGSAGITIDADHVSLDLNGFALVGVPGSLDGVESQVGHQNLSIRNGTIRNWGGKGISIVFFHSEFENLRVVGNGDIGITANDSSLVRNCVANQNLGGIFVGSRTLVTGCEASFNTDTGIRVERASTVIGCVAGSNGNRGIEVQAEIAGGAVLDSTVFANGAEGILAGPGATVARCNSSLNTKDGIRVDHNCRVVDNTCAQNGREAGSGAGIHATGSGNRIEGNHVTNNDRGIAVDAGGNVILRNTVGGNGVNNFDIAAGNVTGTIVMTEEALNAAANANVNVSL